MIAARHPRSTGRKASSTKARSADRADRSASNEKLERLLDEALAGTFPASDPVALYLGKD
jgi:hypothetical protein